MKPINHDQRTRPTALPARVAAPTPPATPRETQAAPAPATDHGSIEEPGYGHGV